MNMIEFLKELEDFTKYFSPEALEFYSALKEKTKAHPVITETGMKILETMIKNTEPYLNCFSSKQIGELLFMPPRSVSGAMRKLISEGYVNKISQNPVAYGLTDKAKELQFDND